MMIIRNTLKLTLILYICVALSGVYVLSASARITPKEGGEETTLITIVKGDTLWHLCQEHLKDPLKWRELSKYNDFTNPDLIYPGEKLRIPLSMAKVIADEAEEKMMVDKEELEKLRAELEESEGTRSKLMSEIEALNASTKKLQAQINQLKNSLESQDKVIKAVNKAATDAATDVKRVVRNARNTLQEKFEGVKGQHDSAMEILKSLQMDLKATQELIGNVEGSIKTLLMNIETNQKGISELKMMMENAKGIHEEVSSGKRALVFVTTAAAGIGWFVLRSIGGRSGE